MGILFNSGPSKLSIVKDNSTEFVDTVHKDGLHYGTVASFNEEYDISSLSSRASRVKTNIDALSASGNTALFDSIIDSMLFLRKAQRKYNRSNVPALVLTLTDGKDNRSDASADDVRQAIRDFGFLPRNNCYFAIAGIGDASQQQLEDICEGGHGIYTHTDDDIDKAFGLFAASTLAVVRGKQSYTAIRKEGDSLTLAAFRRKYAKLGVRPVDYVLTIDRSKSMSKSA